MREELNGNIYTPYRAPEYSAPKEVTGRRINAYLHQKNLSCKKAAELCGIPITTMRMYRTGDVRPSARAMKKLKAIGLTEELVYGKAGAAAAKAREAWAGNEAYIEWFLAQSDEIQHELKDTAAMLYGYGDGESAP